MYVYNIDTGQRGVNQTPGSQGEVKTNHMRISLFLIPSTLLPAPFHLIITFFQHAKGRLPGKPALLLFNNAIHKEAAVWNRIPWDDGS